MTPSILRQAVAKFNFFWKKSNFWKRRVSAKQTFDFAEKVERL